MIYLDKLITEERSNHEEEKKQQARSRERANDQPFKEGGMHFLAMHAQWVQKVIADYEKGRDLQKYFVDGFAKELRKEYLDKHFEQLLIKMEELLVSNKPPAQVQKVKNRGKSQQEDRVICLFGSNYTSIDYFLYCFLDGVMFP